MNADGIRSTPNVAVVLGSVIVAIQVVCRPIGSGHQLLASHAANHMMLTLFSSMILKVKTSEPRDALQSERTCLSFIRFSTTLFVTSFGILLNFKLDSSNSGNPLKDGFISSTYSKVLSYLILVMSVGFLISSGVSYYITINRYLRGRIHNFGFNNLVNTMLIIALVVVLMFVNISLLIDGYSE